MRSLTLCLLILAALLCAACNIDKLLSSDPPPEEDNAWLRICKVDSATAEVDSRSVCWGG